MGFLSKLIWEKIGVLFCSYDLKKSLISEQLNKIGKKLDLFSPKYDNILLIGDVNAEPPEAILSNFCEFYHLKHLI